MEKIEKNDYRYRLKKISPNFSINMSLSTIQMIDNKIRNSKIKHDSSFRNDSLSKEAQKLFLEINNLPTHTEINNTERQNHHMSTKTINSLSHIRKTFLNINNSKDNNSDEDTLQKSNEKMMNLTSLDQDRYKTWKQHKILPSTLPKAHIDISKNESITSKGVNITYNNDDIINIYLKLKSNKDTQISKELMEELILLNKEIDNVIDKYKNCP